MTNAENDRTTSEQTDRKVSVLRKPIGWEVREEEGQNVLRSVLVTDWHRVERAIQAFAQRARPVQADR